MAMGDLLSKCADYWDGIEKYTKPSKNESLVSHTKNLKTSCLSFASVLHKPVELFRNNLFTMVRNTRKNFENIDDVVCF